VLRKAKPRRAPQGIEGSCAKPNIPPLKDCWRRCANAAPARRSCRLARARCCVPQNRLEFSSWAKHLARACTLRGFHGMTRADRCHAPCFSIWSRFRCRWARCLPLLIGSRPLGVGHSVLGLFARSVAPKPAILRTAYGFLAMRLNVGLPDRTWVPRDRAPLPVHPLRSRRVLISVKRDAASSR
jgi:hypothetical protein